MKARGIVVGHETGSMKSSTVYAPVIEFTDWMGRKHRFTSKYYSSRFGKPSEKLNSQVKLLYPKDQPEEVRRDSFMTLWLIPFILVVWGGGFALGTGAGIFSAKQWRTHYAYLQQHAPGVASTADQFARTIRETTPRLTSIGDYRIIDEKPDSIVIEAEYRLSTFKDDNVYMGAITLTDGRSGGEWGYRPAKLKKGFGTARVRLGMSSNAPDRYCTNQIELNMYYGGGSDFYERVIPYEKCWTRNK